MQYVPLVGRILFSAIFIMFGLGHFAQTQMMVDNIVPAYLPAPTLVVWVTGAMIVSGGVMVLLGYRARLGGLLIASFLIPVALMVHFPGFLEGNQVDTANFMKDMALAGGALLIYYFGAGPKSLDAKSAA